ncbi:hypothetical protein LSH36_95g05027 [Paralvinella palmiformis]|uniref:Palmitoyltransferase n=1 Tax=Paralvinella palmiformis TaxID=53620 RepID=A0AAD9K018_9ANNE|nr:hypothetical protein LSH36_95g05027 [Paralvinella palmiformis]
MNLPDIRRHRSRMLKDNKPVLPISIEQWRRRSLWEKLSDSYQDRYHDPLMTRYAHILSVVFFIFNVVSWIHLFLNYYIPVNYSHWEPLERYYLKVFACFIFVQTVGNYICVMCYQSFVERNADKWNENYDNNTLVTKDYLSPQSDDDEIVMEDAIKDDKDVMFCGKFCNQCNLRLPYRAHHCKICKKCVIKRDHHCFFTATCIGHYNQRYFVILCFYISIGCFWGMSEAIRYINGAFGTSTIQWDYMLPVTCFRWLSGSIPLGHLLVMFQMYNLWWIELAGCGFFVWNMYIIALGKTSHEVRKGSRLHSVATLSQRFQFVFGSFWLTNFIFPSVLIFRQEHNGHQWIDLRQS